MSALATAHVDVQSGRAPLVVELASAPREVWPLLGGKGARLAELMSFGFPVPPAFCIPHTVFSDFCRTTGLDVTIETAGKEDSEGCAAIRAAIRQTAIPDSLAKGLFAAYDALGRPRVAVRSSAPDEDSTSHSFAGQHDTFLDVSGDDALLAAVRDCWASLWSDRARAYRQSTGRPAASMAVVVQTMVHAHAAGVLFTIDPVSNAPGRMVLEACIGLGEGLVSGRVASDSYVLDAASGDVLDRTIRYKLEMCTPVSAGAVGIVKVPVERRDQPALDQSTAVELGRLAIALRERFGAEQDIEWAVRDGRLYLLQARPITSRPSRPAVVSPYVMDQPPKVRRGTIWSRMDIGEIFTGRMSPLGISFAKYYQRAVHADCGRALGLRDPGDAALSMGYLHGHVYLNVSYTAHILAQTPPTRDQSQFTSRFTSSEVDLASYQNPFGQYPGGLRFAYATAHWLGYAAREMATMRRRADRMVASRFVEFDRFRALNLAKLSRSELHAQIERALTYFHDMHVGYMPYYMNAFGLYGVLTALCGSWLGADGENLQNRLKADMSNLRTVQVAREVWKLADAARRHDGVAKIFQTVPVEHVIDALRDHSEGRRFVDRQLGPFLRVNGTRGRQEMELTHPRWIDDPSYVVQMVRKYLTNDFSVDSVLARGRTARESSSQDVLARLPASRRAVLRAVIRNYATCSELRETTRMSMITSIWLVRSLVYEVGRRLLAEGILRTIDEVAFLDFDDVQAFLRGERSMHDAFSRPKIDQSRRDHNYYARRPEPPLTFLGEYDSAEAIPAVDASSALQGVGTSPGRVSGRARVIYDLVRQADELEAGDILVASFTDASWTPLFALSAGVVTDIGSMLSHSSIVAREFHIPSVVNTKIATKRIRTGDRIVVDGDRGLVELERASREVLP